MRTSRGSDDYRAGFERGYLQGVRDCAVEGVEAVVGDARLANVMKTPRHVMENPETGVATHAGRWNGEECFVVCGGPSLRDFDFEQLRGRKVICVNRVPMQVLLPQHPDYLICSDMHLWTKYEQWPDFKERLGSTTLVSQPTAFFEYKIPQGLWFFPRPDPMDLVGEPNSLMMHTTVACVAITLAWRLGATKVYLLGLDGYVDEDRSYFWDETIGDPVEHRGTQLMCPKMDRWSEDMVKLSHWFESHNAGIQVLNCSPKSRIEGWPRIVPPFPHKQKELSDGDVRTVQRADQLDAGDDLHQQRDQSEPAARAGGEVPAMSGHGDLQGSGDGAVERPEGDGAGGPPRASGSAGAGAI